MEEKLKTLIESARAEIKVSDRLVDEAMRQLRTMGDTPEGHPVYDVLSTYAYSHDFCQGRISAFKEVLTMLGE